MDGDKRIWTTAELYESGWSKARIRGTLGKDLHRVARGIYTTTKDPIIILRALTVAYPGIVYTGRTAAHLHHASPMQWPVTARHPKLRHEDHFIIIRRRRRPDTVRIKGVDVTTAAHTAADLMDDLPTSVRVLERGYAGFRGTENFEKDAAALSRRDRMRVREASRKAVIGTASGLEMTAVRLIRKALEPELESGLITVETNGMVRGYCFDIVIREVRLVIEIDSWAYHGEAKAKRMDFARDRCKGNQATRWGWLLLRYADSAVDLVPEYMASEVADTVRFELKRLRRFRREDEAIASDEPMWGWYPRI